MEMKLNEKKIIEAINKSLLNADSLCNDGLYLKDGGRIARAFTLFQLSNEETGKAMAAIVIYLYKNYDTANVDEFKKLFSGKTAHTKKGTIAISADLIFSIFLVENFPELARKYFYSSMTNSEQVEKINDLKNLSLYTSYKDNSFINPEEVINEKILEEIEFKAKTRIAIAKQFWKMIIENKIDFSNPAELPNDKIEEAEKWFKEKFGIITS